MGTRSTVKFYEGNNELIIEVDEIFKGTPEELLSLTDED